jgi:putative membrane protein
MQWWCAAAGVPWTWTWRAYPGVWLFMLALACTYVAIGRRAAAQGIRIARGRSLSFLTGWLLLWIALDWPVGALGAGYLASLHMLQFILIGIAAPPLLILGLPPRAPGPPGVHARRLRRRLTHPVVALGFFTTIVTGTHLPAVTDALMPAQLGSFLIDTLWLLAGLVFWWPLLVDTGRAWFTEPVKIAYLFANMVFMTAPGAMITFSDLPIYATYELAPPIPGFSRIEDQRLAGVGMRFGGSTIVFAAISILFLRWNRAEEKLMAAEQSTGSPSGEGFQRGG